MSRIDLYNEDCITGIFNKIPAGSIHQTITSIPFEELFTYSGKPEDVGNNGSTVNIREGRFALNMRFVISQLLRAHAPGTNACIHIQQLLAYKNQHGFIGRRDFRGAIIDMFSAGGFDFTGEFVIPKNPQAMAQRLSLHSLMFVTGTRNSTMLMPAPNDYVLIFQKPGEIEVPVKALKHNENVNGWVTTNEWIRDASGIWSKFSFDQLTENLFQLADEDEISIPAWQLKAIFRLFMDLFELQSESFKRDSLGIWPDINEIDVLDGYRAAREHNEEKHVCPLQLEVIRRLIKLYTNPISIQPNATILDPFMGIGSTAYIAVEQGRNAVGFELKESYYS